MVSDSRDAKITTAQFAGERLVVCFMGCGCEMADDCGFNSASFSDSSNLERVKIILPYWVCLGLVRSRRLVWLRPPNLESPTLTGVLSIAPQVLSIFRHSSVDLAMPTAQSQDHKLCGPGLRPDRNF